MIICNRSTVCRSPKLLLCALGLLAAIVVVACGGDRTPSQRALLDYVGQADASYSWQLVRRVETERAELLELRLNSQTWRGTLWKHQLFLIKPRRLALDSRAVLTVSGGRWSDALDDIDDPPPLPDEFALFAGIAEATGSVQVVLAQVPFQPLFDLTEDQLIAYTFDRFLETREPDWPLLLPMVKSAVRAMDASQAAVRQFWDLDIDGFTVIGGSKRGWTTWLTAAADSRVSAVVPLVIDALNMAEHFPHQTAVWGRPSDEISPYTDRGLDVALSTERGRELREIVDPFAYRAELRLPKLVVNASNDAYFPVDSINLYWDGLVGEKYTLLLPNQTHDANDFGRLIPTLRQLHRHAAGQAEMPRVDWDFAPAAEGLLACLDATPAPVEVRVWTAVSDDRDFRDETWQSSELPGDGQARDYRLARVPGAYTGMFIELVFDADGGPFVLSTTPAVLGPSADDGILSAVSSSDVCARR